MGRPVGVQSVGGGHISLMYDSEERWKLDTKKGLHEQEFDLN